MKSKDLLLEVVGEVQYQNFSDGLGMKLECPDGYTYFVRMINNKIAQVTRRRGPIVERGTLRGSDIYDVVAAFVISVQLNRADWKCGHIVAELPMTMAPKNLSVPTFISEKVVSIFNRLSQLLSWLMSLHNELLNEDGGVGILVVVYAVAPYLALLVVFATPTIIFNINRRSLFNFHSGLVPTMDGVLHLFIFQTLADKMGRKNKDMNSKSLLMEIVGEDLYQDFEAGLGITSKSPDGFVYRITKIDNKKIHVSRRRDTHVESGEIFGTDIHDAVASFIMSVRLGKVSWKCGNIDVKLPANMPPRELSFLSFMGVKIRDGFGAVRQIRSLAVGIHNDLVKDDDGLEWFTVGFLVFPIFVVGFVLLLVELFLVVSFGLHIRISRLWTIFGLTSLAVYCIFLSYRRWQVQWGGEAF